MYTDIKNRTITPENITKTKDNYFCFVNHPDKLVTTGFLQKENLLKYQNDIRFDSFTIERMKKRYSDFFNL